MQTPWGYRGFQALNQELDRNRLLLTGGSIDNNISDCATLRRAKAGMISFHIVRVGKDDTFRLVIATVQMGDATRNPAAPVQGGQEFRNQARGTVFDYQKPV